MVLLKISFARDWVSKLIESVWSIKYLVKCNSRLSDFLIPSKGFHQVDPLSPYLFLFCMDVLSRLLLNAQNNGMIMGIQVNQYSPHINHLFFNDDALLFIKNKKEGVEIMCDILYNFEEMSSQKVNLSKSLLFFSPNTLVIKDWI